MDGITPLLYVLAAVTAVNFVTAGTIVFRKLRAARAKDMNIDMTDFLVNEFEGIPEDRHIPYIDKNIDDFLDRYMRLSQSALLTREFKDKVVRYLRRRGIEHKYIRRLNSPRSFRRSQAAVFLGYFSSAEVKHALEDRVLREKKYYIKLDIAHSLIEIGDAFSLRIITGSCQGAPAWYREKVAALLVETGMRFYELIHEIMDSKNRDLQLIIIQFASYFPDEQLKGYLLGKAKSEDPEIRLSAVNGLFARYPYDPEIDLFYASGDIGILRAAITCAGVIPTRESIARIIPFLFNPDLYDTVISSLSRIIFSDNELFPLLVHEFHSAEIPEIKSGIAEALSNKIDFLLVRLMTDKTGRTGELVYEIMQAGKASGIISFMKRNTDGALEEEILGIIRLVIVQNPDLAPVFAAGLDKEHCGKLGLEKAVAGKSGHRKEYLERGILISLMVAATAGLPAFFLATHSWRLTAMPLIDSLVHYIDTFNISFAFYALVVNASYIILLFLSFAGAVKQKNYYSIKHMGFLFKGRILPSVSIIAPAYNEEAGIIESISSLLNLQYPDYEVIVVNDGSKDRTLDTLIGHFQLEKDDVNIRARIDTMPVRGVYVNRSMPNLLVIDKENGGKADSLNVGINASRKEFFCGIDADSLLESESLIKLMSQFLDSDTEGVAAGGNIFPVNGCVVDGGALTRIGLPKNRLARLQMVEYVRAFMGGRIGWAYLRSLLIISGAFGVFRKERVIEAGGYLTGSGVFGKDTVGEDMELVVRVARHMYEKRLPFRIYYAFNANCWTEVPETYPVFKRQRDRWHRGLLDIMTFHRKLLFNPQFGSIGLLASPYFLIFEVIGPWIELQGYFIFFISCLVGLISGTAFFILFIASVMMGIFISLFSFIIMEREVNYFSLKEIGIMLWYAFAENFGLRQFLSMMRVSGYVNALRKTQGWGVMVRKGFTTGKK